MTLIWYHKTVLQPVQTSIVDTKIYPPFVGAGGNASQLRSSLVSYPKKAKRAVGKKIESNRPDSRLSAICGFDLVAVLIPVSTDIQLLSGAVPDTHPEVTSKDFLETSIISNAPFVVGLLKRILNIIKSQIAPFRASFLGSLKLKLIRKHLNQ